jgi:DNA-binding transcriptional LysR family regulator
MQRVLVAAPRWLRRHGTPREPAELVRQPCLVQVTPAGSVVHWSLQRNAEILTVEVHGQLRSNAPMALRDLAVDAAGIAYLPDFVVAADLSAGRLNRVLPEWASAPINAWAVYRAELRGAARLRAFLEAIAPKAARTAGVQREARTAAR